VQGIHADPGALHLGALDQIAHGRNFVGLLLD